MYESRHCTFIINSIFPSADLVSEGTLVDISVFLPTAQRAGYVFNGTVTHGIAS